MSRSITSVEGFFRKVSKLETKEFEVLFYRGHSNRREFKLRPSLYRDSGWRKREHFLVNDLLSSNPSDFRDDKSMFERLVRMQHHSLPTRLLDITSNPLMALFFACCEFEKFGGEVVIFKIRRSRIKYSDSDTVSCIANAARLTAAERSGIDTSLDRIAFNESDPIRRLLHFIKEEKPYFADVIVPSDMKKIICVRPRMSNLRIASQSGAFLLFGIDAELPEEGNENLQIERVAISAKAKTKICSELEALNIHRGTVYPNIENSALVVREHHRSLKPSSKETNPL